MENAKALRKETSLCLEQRRKCTSQGQSDMQGRGRRRQRPKHTKPWRSQKSEIYSMCIGCFQGKEYFDLHIVKITQLQYQA
jgi:hypothetical protein